MSVRELPLPMTLPLWHGKPVSTRLNVWLHLRTRADWILAFVGVLVLIALSELVLDGLRGARPTAVIHRQIAQRGHVVATQSAAAARSWLRDCAATLPRLAAPARGSSTQMRGFERHLACVAMSPYAVSYAIDGNATLLDLCTGGGGTGWAMYLGAKAFGPGRDVVIEHEDNENTLINFYDDLHRQARLKKFGMPMMTLQRSCEAAHTSVMCLDAAHPVLSPYQRIALLEATRECPRVQFVAIKDMTANEFRDAALAPLTDKRFHWTIVASGTDYVSSTPLFHPFCWFNLDVLCRSAPWLIVYRTEEAEASA